jgi:hypothetical protein
MNRRILLGGVLGGIMMFVWGALSHMVLGLGDASIRKIPNESAVLAVLRDNIREPGFYFFPGMGQTSGMSKEQSEAAQKEWFEKIRTGPNGILVYQPQGAEALSPKQLIIELCTNIAAGLLAALLLAFAVPSLPGYGGRVLFVTALGVLAVIMVNVPYWNWYGFPTNFTLCELADQVIGSALAGAVMAAIIKPAKATPNTAIA